MKEKYWYEPIKWHDCNVKKLCKYFDLYLQSFL